ncbi:MAG: hypothetical protein ACPG5J_08760 [Pseudomonadales bacterium]
MEKGIARMMAGSLIAASAHEHKHVLQAFFYTTNTSRQEVRLLKSFSTQVRHTSTSDDEHPREAS